jgi:hypothetical protein
MGKVDGITVDTPFPSEPRFSDVEARFDRPFAARDELGTASGELFGVDFGAVVFAITLFLCG